MFQSTCILKIVKVRKIYKQTIFHTVNKIMNLDLPVPSQESEWSCICVSGVSILPLSTILTFDFGVVPTVWYFCVFQFVTSTPL